MAGALIYILYTILYSLGFLFSTLLYDRNEDLNSFQMLTMRASFSILLMMVFVNVKLKKAVWDGVDRKSSCPLFFRSVQGSLTNVINFTAAEVVPLTMISIVNNMGPVCQVILAYFILKESLRCFEILMLVLTVVGIFVVVIFADSEDSDTSDVSKAFKYIVYGFLICNPLMSAGGSIAMRKMKKFHDAVVSWYLNWTVLILSVTICLAAGYGFQPIVNFDWVSWCLSFGTGVFGVTS